MSDTDLDRVILACHAARLAFVGEFLQRVQPPTDPYECADHDILAAVIEIAA